jgi:hypothetical protein
VLSVQEQEATSDLPLSRDWIFEHDATAEPMALAG